MPSPLDTTVKFIASWMPGAPQFGPTNIGTLITAMDIMVNGMDSRSGSISVTGGLATLTFAGGAHAAIPHAVILVSASGDVSLDGEQKVLTANATTITFPTNAANGTYTCTFMLAPMGWEKPFTGTNKGVYRSLDVTNERIYLRVEHTSNQYADVRAYRAMTGVDTGTDPFPDLTLRPTFRWGIRQTSSLGNAPWLFVTDGKRMFIHIETWYHTSANYGGGVCHMFGPMISRPEIVDPNNTILTGLVTTTGLEAGGVSNYASGSATAYLYVSKEYTGIGTYKELYCTLAANPVTNWATGATAVWGNTYPDPVTGALITSEIYTIGSGTTAATGGVRGKIPAYQVSVQTTSGVFAGGDVVEINGRNHFAIRVASGVSITNAATRNGFIDIEGPWT